MKAVGFWQPGESTSVIEDLSLPHPSMPKGRDLLIRVRAVAVNPRDLKSRRNISPSAGNPVVMGYDASGVVEATGPDVTLFRPGDHVFYAGVLDRQGANAEFQLVDERITGIKPAALSFEAAASVPLTGLTAWEMLFDRLQLSVNGDADCKIVLVWKTGKCKVIALAPADGPKYPTFVRLPGRVSVKLHSHLQHTPHLRFHFRARPFQSGQAGSCPNPESSQLLTE